MSVSYYYTSVVFDPQWPQEYNTPKEVFTSLSLQFETRCRGNFQSASKHPGLGPGPSRSMHSGAEREYGGSSKLKLAIGFWLLS